MIRLEMKNYEMILTENQQKYQYFYLEKLISSCYRMVLSAIWQIFSEFPIFCNLFHEP